MLFVKFSFTLKVLDALKAFEDFESFVREIAKLVTLEFIMRGNKRRNSSVKLHFRKQPTVSSFM